MDQVGIRAIQAMLAPVVLMSTAAILAGGIHTMYAGVNDRMRAMAAERLSCLTTSRGDLTTSAELPAGTRARLLLIDVQLPILVRRHLLLRNALLALYLAVLFVVIAMLLVAIAVTVPSSTAADAALIVVLIATSALLVGLMLVAASVRQSANAVDYEVDEILRLGSVIE